MIILAITSIVRRRRFRERFITKAGGEREFTLISEVNYQFVWFMFVHKKFRKEDKHLNVAYFALNLLF